MTDKSDNPKRCIPTHLPDTDKQLERECQIQPEPPYTDIHEDELSPEFENSNVAVRKHKPRISEVNRKVDELAIAHDETGREMADAIVETAYKQISRHYDLDFANKQQEREIKYLKAKMERLERLIESANLNSSSQSFHPKTRRANVQHSRHLKDRKLFEDIEEDDIDEHDPPVTRYEKGKSPVRNTYDDYDTILPSVEKLPIERHESRYQSTTRLRSSEEPNYQGPPFAKYCDSSEMVGQTYGNVSLGIADRIINPIREFSGTDDLGFFENWLILLRGRIQDNDGHWGSDQRIMNFIFASTKGKAQEMLVPYFSGEDADNDFVNSVQMINHLIASHRSSTLQRDSMVDFEALRQGASESSQNFKIRFLSLAGKAKIHHSLRKDLMYEKMNRHLKLAVFTQLHILPDFNSLCQFAEPVDKERIRLEKSAANTRLDKSNVFRKSYQPESSTANNSRYMNYRSEAKEERPVSNTVICYHCKRAGHTETEFPNRTSGHKQTMVQVVADDSSGTILFSGSDEENDNLEKFSQGKEES